MRAYKITDASDRTYRDFQWHEGMVHKTDGKGELCSSGWIHFYRDKRLAILLNPIHGNYHPYHLCHLWLGRIPKITLIQKVAFGILCSLETCTDQKYKKWAEDWLQNKDRTTETAKAANRNSKGSMGSRMGIRSNSRDSNMGSNRGSSDNIMGSSRGRSTSSIMGNSTSSTSSMDSSTGSTDRAARVAWIVARAAQIAAGEVEINLVRLATECLKY